MVAIRAIVRKLGITSATLVIMTAGLSGCGSESSGVPDSDGSETPLTGDEVAAIVCSESVWTDALNANTSMFLTSVDSIESTEDIISCHVQVAMSGIPDLDSTLGLELQVSGRRSELLDSYRAAIDEGAGTCDALRDVGQLTPGDDPQYLQDAETDDGDRVCLGDLRSIAEAWVAAEDWYFYLVILPDEQHRDAIDPKNQAITDEIKTRLLETIVPAVGGCEC